EEFRANEGKVGGRWEGRNLLLLTTAGRKSGRAHTTPVVYTRDGDRLLVYASKGGAPKHPDWYLNLVADPHVVVEVGADRYHAVGQVAVLLQGPDTEDAFAWEAFKTHANAIGDLDHPALSTSVKIVDTVPGYKESLLLTGTLGGKKLYDAVTVDGTVLVQAVTLSARGNKAGAIALLRAAVKHLRAVRG